MNTTTTDWAVWTQADAEPLKLSWDKAKRLWKKCIGTKLGADGTVKQRLFWLGADQQIALHRAKVLRRCWRRMNAVKPTHWTPEAETWAEACIGNERAGSHMLANYAQRLTQDLAPTVPTLPPPPPSARPAAPDEPETLTVKVLAEKYLAFARGYYRNGNGETTGEVEAIDFALRMLAPYHSKPAAEFGPLAYKGVRDSMIAKGWTRIYVTHQCGRIKRMLKWAVENELVPPTVLQGVQAVAALRRGRSAAKESQPVKPVPEPHVESVRQQVSETIRDIIDLQLITGMRPGEVLQMTGEDIDRSEELWKYAPEKHKNAYRGHERVVYLGPKAQAVLTKYLGKRKPNKPLFSPAETERARRKAMHKERATPLSCGNRPGKRSGGLTPKRARPPGDRYTIASYRRAIARACRSAKVPSWHPHQLRHNAATRLRKEYGLEAAQIILGHKSLSVTQVYAERDSEAAAKIMSKAG